LVVERERQQMRSGYWEEVEERDKVVKIARLSGCKTL